MEDAEETTCEGYARVKRLWADDEWCWVPVTGIMYPDGTVTLLDVDELLP